jgi:hypothetical protein
MVSCGLSTDVGLGLFGATPRHRCVITPIAASPASEGAGAVVVLIDAKRKLRAHERFHIERSIAVGKRL